MIPKRLLIVEFLCAGFVDLGNVAQSMLREGRAMLLALLEDASRIDGIQVTTLWNGQLEELPGLPISIQITSTQESAYESWQQAMQDTDAVYIIAPETDDILRQLCEEAWATGKRVLNCVPEAIDAAGDKWETYMRLTAAGLPTIPTHLLEDVRQHRDLRSSATSWVIKPRFGCGSAGIRVSQEIDVVEPNAAGQEMIVQPFMAGQPASVVAVFDEEGRPRDIFPVGLQRLSEQLQYTGGRIPAVIPNGYNPLNIDLLTSTLQKLNGLFRGLRGYVGCDLLIQPDGSFRVVEINPRLTTSYIGYRRLTESNLAERWLSSSQTGANTITWSKSSIEFTADGIVTFV